MQRYDSYKDSGVEWLGEVPSHWDILPGFTCFKENKDRNKGLVEKTVLSLSYGRIVVKPEDKLTGLVPESFETYQIIRPSDIVIRPTDLQNDYTSLRIGLAKNHGIITSAYIGLRCKPDINPIYIFRLLESYDAMKVFYGMGSGLRQNMDFKDFKRLPIILPPHEEQDRIVAFLDEKTAEIDAAIAKKERLIELLKEQKNILINRAVTRGLNPYVAMQDSGVEWIGEIPSHWKVAALKRVLKSMDYGLSESSSSTGKFKILNMGHVQDGKINTHGSGYLVSAPENLLLKNNDILFNRTNSFDLVGKTGIYEGSENNLTFASYLVRLRTKSDINPAWLNYLMNTDTFLFFIRTLALRSLNQANLNPTRLGLVSIPIPPVDEQIYISEWLNLIEERTRDIAERVKLEIEVIKQYRTCIIYHAVSGRVQC